MLRVILSALNVLILSAATAASAAPAVNTAGGNWTEGVNYFLIQPARATSVPLGKVEVTEVFSYGCPACNVFTSTMHKLKQSMPANVVVDYLPAAFNTAEDWPMFRQAYLTAQVLGVAEQTHDAMFDAVWKTGELAITDQATGNVKSHQPTIEDAAQFYQKHAGVPAAKFIETAKSFSVDVKVRAAEELVMAYRVDRTPTIVVNGKYRVHVQSAGSPEQLVDLVKWLVAKETK